MNIRHRTAITFSGISWLMIGSLLIYRGIKYLMEAFFSHKGSTYLLSFFQTILGHPKWGVIALAIAALVVGWVKGWTIFSKTVHRVVTRITSLSSPLPLQHIYTRGYWALILTMSSVGMCFRFLPLSSDIKGFLDLAIGTALVIGSGLYFHRSLTLSLPTEG